MQKWIDLHVDVPRLNNRVMPERSWDDTQEALRSSFFFETTRRRTFDLLVDRRACLVSSDAEPDLPYIYVRSRSSRIIQSVFDLGISCKATGHISLVTR
jgi:hypothetical protein